MTLEVSDVTVRYGHHTAVRDISFDVRQGETVGLVGESGSGKTTIGRAVAGLTAIDSGEIRWQRRKLGPARDLADRRAIQMVFQDPFGSLNPALSVKTVLAELLRVHGLFRPGRVEELLGQVALPAAVAKARPAQLSGGERQRVAIARALAVGPLLVVADEPTSALDVSVQASVLDLFAELSRKLGVALLVISHDIGVINYLCDRVMVLSNGQVVERGPTNLVLADPQDPYTRQLLASVPRLPDQLLELNSTTEG